MQFPWDRRCDRSYPLSDPSRSLRYIVYSPCKFATKRDDVVGNFASHFHPGPRSHCSIRTSVRGGRWGGGGETGWKLTFSQPLGLGLGGCSAEPTFRHHLRGCLSSWCVCVWRRARGDGEWTPLSQTKSDDPITGLEHSLSGRGRGKERDLPLTWSPLPDHAVL